MNRSGCRRALQPEHPVLAIHMGGSGAGYPEADELYRQARELGLRRSNIRYVLSAKRDTHIESDLIAYTQAGEPFCRNLSCASDAPYGRMTWNFGGFRAMFRSLQDGPTTPIRGSGSTPACSPRKSSEATLAAISQSS